MNTQHTPVLYCNAEVLAKWMMQSLKTKQSAQQNYIHAATVILLRMIGGQSATEDRRITTLSIGLQKREQEWDRLGRSPLAVHQLAAHTNGMGKGGGGRRGETTDISLPVRAVRLHHANPVHYIDAAAHTTKYGMLPCR